MSIFRKSPEGLRRQTFEKQCEEAAREVIQRGKGMQADDSSEVLWPYETFAGANNGRPVTRLRTSVFVWAALAALGAGLVLFGQNSYVGLTLSLVLAPCLLLYPVVRAVFGGRDSLRAAVITVVVEEVLKRGIINVVEKRTSKRP